MSATSTTAINFYSSVVILPVGLVVNSLGVFVFLRKSLNNKTNMGFLYSTLCICNIVALVTSIFVTQFLPFYGLTLATLNGFFCEFITIWKNFALQMPSFVQVLISLEMFVGVCYPNKFRYIRSNKKRIMWLILCIFICALCLNLFYISYDLRTTTTATNVVSYINRTNSTTNKTVTERVTTITYSTRTRCSSVDLGLRFAADLINIALRNMIPFTIMLIVNILLTRKIIISRHKSNAKANESLKKQYQFAISVLTINFLFLILYIPWSTTFVFDYINRFKASPDLDLLLAISNVIANINDVSPVLINMVCNKLFQKEVLSLFRYNKNNKVTQSQSTKTTRK